MQQQTRAHTYYYVGYSSCIASAMASHVVMNTVDDADDVNGFATTQNLEVPRTDMSACAS